ncbi:MAG: hypothetical protein ACREU5_09560 [Burkholderiales bacterium]
MKRTSRTFWRYSVRIYRRSARLAKKVVQPLRRALGKSNANLRQNVLRLELDAEYVEQLLLARLAAKLPRPVRKQDPQTTSAANLERYLELLGASIGRITKRRMNILCQA